MPPFASVVDHDKLIEEIGLTLEAYRAKYIGGPGALDRIRRILDDPPIHL